MCSAATYKTCLLYTAVVENVKENLNQNIYKTTIPRNVRLAEAPSYGQPINIYDPRSAGACLLYTSIPLFSARIYFLK